MTPWIAPPANGNNRSQLKERRSITENLMSMRRWSSRSISRIPSSQLLQSEGELRMGGMIHGEIQRIVNGELKQWTEMKHCRSSKKK